MRDRLNLFRVVLARMDLLRKPILASSLFAQVAALAVPGASLLGWHELLQTRDWLGHEADVTRGAVPELTALVVPAPAEVARPA